MNMKAAFLEVMNDALGSVAVIVSASVLICTGWAGFDAVAGGIIALMMIPRAIKLLRNAVRVLLEETPNGLDLDEVRSHLEQVPHVVAVHDIHASIVSTGMPIFMAHVVVEQGLTMKEAAEYSHNYKIACANISPYPYLIPPSNSNRKDTVRQANPKCIPKHS